MVFRKFSEITNNKPIFRHYNIFYKNISFFNLHFDLFLIIPQKVNQIKNNVVGVIAPLVVVFFFVLTIGHCNVFQHISVN